MNDDQIIAKALAILEARCARGAQITSESAAIEQLYRLKIAENKNESFWIVGMDSQHRVIRHEKLFDGTIDGASVYCRPVVQWCLAHNAAAVIFVHNHPSGVFEPSKDDVSITKRLKSALELIDTRVLDHLVVSSRGSCSLAARGLI